MADLRLDDIVNSATTAGRRGDDRAYGNNLVMVYVLCASFCPFDVSLWMDVEGGITVSLYGKNAEFLASVYIK